MKEKPRLRAFLFPESATDWDVARNRATASAARRRSSCLCLSSVRHCMRFRETGVGAWCRPGDRGARFRGVRVQTWSRRLRSACVARVGNGRGRCWDGGDHRRLVPADEGSPVVRLSFPLGPTPRYLYRRRRCATRCWPARSAATGLVPGIVPPMPLPQQRSLSAVPCRRRMTRKIISEVADRQYVQQQNCTSRLVATGPIVNSITSTGFGAGASGDNPRWSGDRKELIMAVRVFAEPPFTRYAVGASGVNLQREPKRRRTMSRQASPVTHSGMPPGATRTRQTSA